MVDQLEDAPRDVEDVDPIFGTKMINLFCNLNRNLSWKESKVLQLRQEFSRVHLAPFRSREVPIFSRGEDRCSDLENTNFGR